MRLFIKDKCWSYLSEKVKYQIFLKGILIILNLTRCVQSNKLKLIVLQAEPVRKLKIESEQR